MGGVKESCTRELYEMSLRYIEEIYNLRNDKLESLGLDEKGIPFIESESKSSIIFNMYKVICDVNAPLPILFNYQDGVVT